MTSTMTEASPVANVSLKQQAYDYIRTRLIRGDISPGMHLSEVAWAKEIGISRTPVREAINHLLSEGLLVRSSGAGVTVKSTNRKELGELYDVRRVLEGLAVGLAARFATAEDIAAMEQQCKIMEDAALRVADEKTGDVIDSEAWPEFVLADVQFHILIMQAGGNERVSRMINESHMLTALCGHYRGHPSIDPSQGALLVCREHRAVLNAIIARDPKLARRTLNWHHRAGKAKALANYDWSVRNRPDSSADWPDATRSQIRKLEGDAARDPQP